MSFLNLQIKYIFFAVLFLSTVLFFVYQIYKKNKSLNSSSLAKMRNFNYSFLLFQIKISFLLISIFFLLFAFFRPTWGLKKTMVKSNGLDLVFTLDVSKSMQSLDTDAGENISRLDNAKEMISSFVENYPQNRYGLIIFAGEAFVSTPLTTDHSAFLTFLSGVDSSDVSEQGTNLSEALKSSINRFYKQDDKKRGRAIVLMSDGGEDFGEDLSDFSDLMGRLSIKIITIGVGGDEEVPIPAGADLFGRSVYKRYRGEVVTTKLNDKGLKKIANKCDGEYFHIKNAEDVKKINSELKNLETSIIENEEKSGQEDRYQIFLLTSFLFFIFYLFFPLDMRYFNFIVMKIKSFKPHNFRILFILFLSLFLSSCSRSPYLFSHYLNKGNNDFSKKQYEESKKNYKKAGDYFLDKAYLAENNYAISDYVLKNYKKAQEKLEKELEINCSNKKEDYCDQLYYNLGNTYYRLGEQEEDDKMKISSWQKAVELYKKDLEINSNDIEAQENIDFIEGKIKEKQQEQQNKQGQEGQSQDSKDSQSGEQENSDKNSKDGKQGKDAEGSKSGEQSGEDEQGEKGDNNSSKKKDGSEQGEQSSAGEQGEQKNGEQGNESGQEQSVGQQSVSDGALDKETDQKLDEYLKSLENQEQKYQKYFKQNPQAQTGQNSDPFFDDFFSNSFFDFDGLGELDNNKKDW